MSSLRQNNLFAAEDWKVIYDAFTNVNLQAYDYGSIYNALVEYLRINNPDEFNDYVTHSEMLAHINMLSYLGQSLSFRIDLNARENFFDTAERRESILKLAYSLSYNPSRNKTSNGLVKITSLITTEPILDSQGNSLAGREIAWNQVNDSEWYDNFIRVLNSSFNNINKFGNPLKSQHIDNITTDLYAINTLNDNGYIPSYPFTAIVNGGSYTFELVNTSFNNNSISEPTPNPNNSFNIVYRNDNNGVSSTRTGFFIQFKEGTLGYADYFYKNPIPNRHEFIDVENINDTDVWVQEIDNNGSVIEEWIKVNDSLSTQNVIYNSTTKNQRSVFFVKTEESNKVSIVYGDGSFADVPLGNMRVWYRTSVNESYIIRPNDIRNKSKTFIYIGNDGQEYQLTVKFSLVTEISNSEPEESNSSISIKAPLLHYTQDRMVNGEDYNLYPTTKSTQIKKLKTVNRTYAGHSRYIDVSDPTGSLSNVNIVGKDGLLFKEFTTLYDSEIVRFNTNYASMVYQRIEPMLANDYFKLFFYDVYRKTILSDPTTGIGGNGNDYWSFPSGRYVWRTLPNKSTNKSGYFFDTVTNSPVVVGNVSTIRELGYIRQDSILLFRDLNGNEKWSTVQHMTNNGIVDLSYMTTGTISLSNSINNGWFISMVIPSIRYKLNNTEAINIENELSNRRSFGLRYDVEASSWILIPQDNIINTDNDTFNLRNPDSLQEPDYRWLLKVLVMSDDNNNVTYEFIGRGIKYVCGSSSEVQFYFKNTQNVIDPVSGRLVRDYIEISDTNSDRINVDNTTLNGRAIIGQFYTKSNHTASTEYDISIIVGLDNDYSRLRFIDIDNNLLSYNIVTSGINDYKVRFNNLAPNTIVKVSDFVTLYQSECSSGKLKRPYKFSVIDNYVNRLGKTDYSKVTVIPHDEDLDGIMDFPTSFDDIVSPNEVVILTTTSMLDGTIYEYVDLDIKSISSISGEFEIDTVYFCDSTTTINDSLGESITYEYGNFYLGIAGNKATHVLSHNGKTYRYVYGRSHTNDESFIFNWNHYADSEQRIDPSVSNVMACYVLTNQYDYLMRLWVKRSGKQNEIPLAPTADTIRQQLRQVEQNKMFSDQMIYIPANYKLLFGVSSLPQYQATFKVIKTLGTIVTDNEIKSRIISAINEYFELDNWEFGDAFYFSELNSYIHSKLVGIISSIVLVPRFQNSSFGDLFVIDAEPNELFLSTATVDDIEIVRSYNDYNLRKR